ncbi:hypothetical protein [Streptomyces sp. NPDC058440]|uniref:hypothetical protein n=1 Tax=unclassified Streptomyces TaxID=2593676 RepID=UPI00365202F2
MARACTAPQDSTVRGWDAGPGKGADAPVDVLPGQRRTATEALGRRQRAAA